MFHSKPLILACLFVSVISTQPVTAQWYSPYSGYNNYGNNTYGQSYNPYNSGNAYAPAYGSGYGYNPGYSAPNYNRYSNNPYSYNRPAYGPAYNRPAYGPSYNQPYAYSPYYGYRKNDNEMKRFFNKGPFDGNSDFMEELWPGRDSVYEDVLPMHGPWDRNWGRAPWNRDYADLWDEGGPDKWFDPSDPKEGMAWMWEDMLYTPNALGTMPGGWEAPSISVPNPVDVGDEFKDAARDMPGEVKDFSEGFTYGDRTVTGGKPKNDSGSIGIGNKKKDGINIEPKVRK